MMHLALPLLILIGRCIRCWSACTYPSALIGEWQSMSFGTLNFVTNQSFSGFTSDLSSAPLTFTCFESSGSQYVSKATYTLFSQIVVDVYLCMNLQEISTIKYYFTLDGNLDSGTGVRFYSPVDTGDTVTLEQACSSSDTRSPGEYELLIKKDQLLSAVTSCPADLQSTFDVTMTTSSATSCTGSKMEGSTGALVFNYSSCVTGQFNSGGYLQCLYSKTDGYSYATLYNNDTTTDGSSTFQFTCITYQKDAATVMATESPNTCHQSQTTTSVDSPGITYVMIDTLYTPPEEKDYTTIIIVVCCVAAVIIIVIVVVVILYFKVCRKPKPEPPPKIRKKKRKLSITEYTPRSLGRGSSVEKLEEGAIKKKSTEEILTGLDAEKKDKHVFLNGDAYEPPKKEGWQYKWEKLMRPKKVLPTIKHNFPRPQTPVKLFQNIKIEEPASAVTKALVDRDKGNEGKVKLTENESSNENKNKATEEVYVECRAKDGISNDISNRIPDQDTSTECDKSCRALLSVVDEKECKTNNLLLVKSNKLSKKHARKKRTAVDNKKEAIHKVSSSYKRSTDSLEHVSNDLLNTSSSNEHVNTEKERRDISTTNDKTEIDEADNIIDVTETNSVSTRSDSIRTLEQVEYDSVSMHSELFYPDDWLYYSCSALDQIWKIGAKATLSKKKREYKQYIGTDEDMVQKKEISPFKKMKNDS